MANYIKKPHVLEFSIPVIGTLELKGLQEVPLASSLRPLEVDSTPYTEASCAGWLEGGGGAEDKINKEALQECRGEEVRS